MVSIRLLFIIFVNYYICWRENILQSSFLIGSINSYNQFIYILADLVCEIIISLLIMFRQKIAQVTDCSCRLIPSHSNHYQLFKPQKNTLKTNPKQPKQKFSLKTQTISSSKLDNKLPSANKIYLKNFKPNEQQKISISANLDAKKHKFQKKLICSPENSNPRKLDQQTILATNSNTNQSYFTKMLNSVKSAEVNRKIEKKYMLNSHNQKPLQEQKIKDPLKNNFIYQKVPPNQKYTCSRVMEIPNQSLNFEDYYRYVSNPYSINEKNKQNFHMAENSQLSKYKIDIKMKKEMRKLKNQNFPLQEIDIVPQTQVFHESLEKYDDCNFKLDRGTHNGSRMTQNSLNSQPDSMKNSKNQQFSLISSKMTNFQQNSSLRFQKVCDQGRKLRENQSLVVWTQIDPKINSHRVCRKDQKDNLKEQIQNHKEKSIPQINRPFSSIENSNVTNFMSPLDDISVINVKPETGQLFEGINNKQPANQRIFIQKIKTLNDIMNRSGQCESLIGEGELTSENQESVVIMRYQDLLQETQDKGEVEGSQFWLHPQHLLGIEKATQKAENGMLDSTKITTNVKTYERQGYNSTGDSSIFTDPNLKRTVKVSKEYLTGNFNQPR